MSARVLRINQLFERVKQVHQKKTSLESKH